MRNFSASMSFQHLDIHFKSTSRCESLQIHLKDIGTAANKLDRFTVIVQHSLIKQEQIGVENLNFEFIHADASIITSELGNEMAVTIGNVKMLASSTGVFQLSKLLEHSLLPKRVHSLSLYNISISCHGVDATFRQLDYLSSPLKWRLICTELLVVNKEKYFNLQSQSSALSLYKVTSPSTKRWAPFLASKSTRCAIENSELNRWASLSIDSLEAGKLLHLL